MVTIALCVRGLVRLAEIRMRTRVELAQIAAASPHGAEVVEQGRRQGTWRFHTSQRRGAAHG